MSDERELRPGDDPAPAGRSAPVRPETPVLPESPRRPARRSAGLDAASAALVARSLAPEHRDEAITTRTLLTRRWMIFHVTTFVLAIAMVCLGWWQLTVSDDRGFALQNFSYWLQWWLFAGCAVVFWARAIRIARRPPVDRRTDGVVVPAGGTGLARRDDGAAADPTGQVDLVAPDSTPQQPVLYRGYVMPRAAQQPVRSHGDDYHDAYNDYLWQISLADGATEPDA